MLVLAEILVFVLGVSVPLFEKTANPILQEQEQKALLKKQPEGPPLLDLPVKKKRTQNCTQVDHNQLEPVVICTPILCCVCFCSCTGTQ